MTACPFCTVAVYRLPEGFLCPRCLKAWSVDGKPARASYRTPEKVAQGRDGALREETEP